MINTSISRTKKSDFNVFEKISDNAYKLRWGKKDEVERVYKINEETKRPEFTGEIKDTDYCTYESGVYRGGLNQYILDNIILKGAKRQCSIQEYIDLLAHVEMNDDTRLDSVKNKATELILAYDSSDNVNNFTMQGIPVWLDKATRSGLLLRFESEKAKGLETTTLWYNYSGFTLNIDQAIQMLYAIELYASECYDRTAQHIATIKSMNDIKEISQYDYTTGYPAKLEF